MIKLELIKCERITGQKEIKINQRGYTQSKKWKEIKMYDDEISARVVVERNYPVPIDKLNMLKCCIDYGTGDAVDNVFDIIKKEEGISIDDTFFEWDKIKHLF